MVSFSSAVAGPSAVTSCRSQPSEYSVLYALDMYLANQQVLYCTVISVLYCVMSVLQDYEQYEEYYDDVSVFDSSDYENQEDAAGEVDYFLGRRRRRQAQLAWQGEDPFLSKVSGDNREVGG